MRSLVLAVFTAAAVVATFFVVSSLQDEVQPTTRRAMPATRDVVVGEGMGAWVKQFHPDDGRLLGQFRAQRYAPNAEGAIDVEQPVFEQYQRGADGSARLAMRVAGARGWIQRPRDLDPGAARFSGPPPQMPRRGRLLDVRVEVFEADSAEPVLTVQIPNVLFDVDTFHVTSGPYTDSEGREVPADRVPVTVRGRDYELDGQGFSLRWNEPRQRLQQLRIEHGERLLVRQAGTFLPTEAMAADRVALASTVLDGALLAQATAPADLPATRPKRRNTYAATFREDVRVLRDNEPVAVADELVVLFGLGEARSARPVSTQPVSRPARPRATTASTKPAVAPPATARASNVTVLWTGPAVIEPSDIAHADTAPPPGHTILSMTGSPVVLRHQGDTIRCAGVIYHSASGDAVLRRSRAAEIIVERTGDTPMQLTCNELRLRGEMSLVLIRGPGRVSLSPDDAAKSSSIRWSEGGEVRLSQQTVQSVQLRGAVRLASAEMDLQANQLDLDMTDAASPGRATLSGDARAMLRRDGRETTLRGDSIALTAARDASGGIYPALVEADGAVHASEGQRTLTADHLMLELAPGEAAAAEAPTTRPDAWAGATLKRLHASGKVKLNDPAGAATASAEHLHIRREGQRQVIELQGAPATLTQNDWTARGPLVVYHPDDGHARIQGAGQLEQDAAGQKALLAWKQFARLDPAANRIRAEGEVQMRGQGNGLSYDGTCDAVEVMLAPADASTSRPASATRPSSATQPAGSMLAIDSAIGNRRPKSIALIGQVNLGGEQSDAAGKLQQRFRLIAPRVDAELADGVWSVIRIDEAGSLLLDDRGAGQGAGATAVQWKGALRAERARDLITVSRDVVLVHDPAGDAKRRVRLEAQQLVAELDLARQAPDGDTAVRLVRAQDSVSARSADIELSQAAEIRFAPGAQILEVRSPADMPAQLIRAAGYTAGTFTSLRFNLAEGQIESIRDFTARMRGVP